jgi:hypothetical protein
MVSEPPKMKHSNTHREYVTLYCSQPTQTQDSEAEESEFAPCREANSTPPYSPGSILSRPRLQASSQLTISKEGLSKSSHHQRRPNAGLGLGQTNVVNTVSAAARARHAKVIPYYHMYSHANGDCIARVVILFGKKPS